MWLHEDNNIINVVLAGWPQVFEFVHLHYVSSLQLLCHTGLLLIHTSSLQNTPPPLQPLFHLFTRMGSEQIHTLILSPLWTHLSLPVHTSSHISSCTTLTHFSATPDFFMHHSPVPGTLSSAFSASTKTQLSVSYYSSDVEAQTQHFLVA